ncbi:MAG: sensor histidine kinase [Saprospiraceae bacterium]
MLRAQMNPHFVFNSLNSIQGFFANNKFRVGNEFLGKFSRLIRRVLDQSVVHEITLREELETLELYLELEKVRMNDRLHYQFHFDPNLESEFIKVPPLVLQPFVENAIWHGIAPKNDDGRIDIYLKTNATEDRLNVIVEDDGIGLKLKTAPSDHQSRGIQITRERLGKDSLVTINNRKDRTGVRVEIEFAV